MKKKKDFWKQQREHKTFKITVNMPKAFDCSFMRIALIGMMIDVVKVVEINPKDNHASIN